MHELAPLIYDLAIILGFAGAGALLFQRIHQPVVLGYLIVGMIVGPYTLPYAFVTDVTSIQILSELGVIFLMFSLGLEFSFHKLARVGFSASVVGIIEVVLMMILGYGAGLLMNWTQYDSLFLGAALAISSTTIIIKAIDELHLKTKRFAELIFGILIVEDLLAILLLVALSTIVITQNFFSKQMFFAVLQLIMVVGGWFLIGYFLVPPLFRRIAIYISSETLTIISVALCLMLVCVAASFHYSTALGAFIMGSILAETILINRIEKLILPIRDIFAAVFFVSVGMLFDPMVIVNNWLLVLFLTVLTIFGKIIITSFVALITGQSLNTSIRSGFSMAQVGEFSFIIVSLGLALNVTSNTLYPVIVAVSAVTTFSTPYLIRLSAYVVKFLENRLPHRVLSIMNSYHAWVYRSRITSDKKRINRTVLKRLLINGIIIAIIFSTIHYLAFQKFGLFPTRNWIINTVLLLVSIIISSPFIWGMLFCFKNIDTKPNAFGSTIAGTALVWAATFFEIFILNLLYFHTWITILILFVIPILFFIFAYRYLQKSYHWFETQLIKNIKTKKRKERHYEELAPWDTHLVEVKMGDQSPFANKTIKQCQIREEFGINIVAISHGQDIVPAPRGNELILAQDRLIILGDDEQIDSFKKQAEISSKQIIPTSFLNTFKLSALILDKSNKMVGKTIRASELREMVNGLVVGIERKNKRILNPDPKTILHENDMLLIVGEEEKIKKIL